MLRASVSPMRISLLLLMALSHTGVARQLDSIFRGGHCKRLVTEDGNVVYVDEWPPRRVVRLGGYLEGSQALVPTNEAPVRFFRSEDGWTVVLSAFLDHREDSVFTRLRLLSPAGVVATVRRELGLAENFQVGRLFGDTRSEEHTSE